jgi:DNA-binding PadR family transcriptional regulator
MKGSNLGEFEELVMLTCVLLKNEAYGIRIVEEIFTRMDRKVNLSAVHVTLYRLEDKGLVTSTMAGATAQRGGRRKRIFEVTSMGVRILRETKAKRENLWSLIPELNPQV